MPFSFQFFNDVKNFDLVPQLFNFAYLVNILLIYYILILNFISYNTIPSFFVLEINFKFYSNSNKMV